MMNRSTSVAYIDLLSVCFALFVVISALLLSTVIQKKGDVSTKAEFVVIAEWPDGSASDVDLWVRGPTGDTMYYKRKDTGLITLDRDDRGLETDTTTGADGTVVVDPHRREMASVHGIVPGRYVVNVDMYSLRDPPPVKVHVQVIKLNPYSVVVDEDVALTVNQQELTVVSFDVGASGAVIDVDTSAQESLLE